MRFTRPARLLSLAALAIITVGCTYTAEVYNNTDHDLVLELVQTDPVAPDWILATKRVPARDHATLGPERIPMGTVTLAIITDRDPLKQIRQRLKKGNSAWDITERESEQGPAFKLTPREPTATDPD